MVEIRCFLENIIRYLFLSIVHEFHVEEEILVLMQHYKNTEKFLVESVQIYVYTHLCWQPEKTWLITRVVDFCKIKFTFKNKFCM